MPATDFAFYVSGHGFGHATRSAALIAALCARRAAVAVRSEAPRWIFERRAPGVACSAAPIDVGLLQPSGLDLDLDATLAAHEAFCAEWDAAVAREAAWLRARGARAVVADVPALAFAAARRAGVPAFGVANFSWDWILDAWSDDEPRWRPVVARYRDAYSGARRLFRLPMHGDLSAFPRIVDAPLLVNRAPADVAACRRASGIAPDEPRRVVLVSFGGMGRSAFDASGEDLGGYLFIGVGPKPAGFRGAWRAIAGPSDVAHEVLIRASDALLGKPGYSTVAEVLAHERRMLFLRRAGFRENDVLVAALDDSSAEMPRADFEAGRWRPHLDALFARPAPPPAPRADGADFIADALLAETTD